MDGLQNGKRVSRSAYLNDDLTVTITGQKPIAWEAVPAVIRAKLKPVYDRLAAKKAASDAGIVTLYGKVIGRTPTGFLVAWREVLHRDSSGNPHFRDPETVHITGKTDLTDDSDFNGKVKRDGVYQYTNTIGAVATVKNFALLP